MKNPWKVLDIHPTADPVRIKRAYHTLAKKYHPDKADTPDKQIKYTIRFIEIKTAYELATQYAECRAHRGPAMSGMTDRYPMRPPPLYHRHGRFGDLGILAGIVLGIGFVGMLGKYALSFPDTHLFPILFSVILGLCTGNFVGFFIFAFLMVLFYGPMMTVLDKLGLITHANTIAWGLTVVLWIVIVCVQGVPEPNVKDVISTVIWDTAWGFGPIYFLINWIADQTTGTGSPFNSV